MKHISILACEGSNLGSIDNPRRAFNIINQYFINKGKSPEFKVEIVGISPSIKLDNGMCTIHADNVVKAIDKTDLIIIPAFDGDIETGLSKCKEFIPWIVKHYKAGAEIASLCVGAFLLASTGLINGRNCSTHWRVANEFRQKFPEVNLIAEKVITDENGIYTSGGAFSSANLILYIIEKYAGRDAAIFSSKIFQVDFDRISQSPFIIFQEQKGHEDVEIKKAQEFIEKNYQERITVDQLTSLFAIGRRSFERRFKKATSNSVVEYMQRVKIEVAKLFLESGRDNVNEVMYQIGYSDPKSFRTVFKKITGLSPLAYKNKYNKEVKWN